MSVKTKAALSSVVALNLALVAGTALAYEPGDIVLRAGLAHVDPDSSSSAILLNGSPAPATADRVSVDSNTQLGLTGTYMFMPNFAVEVLAATPFSHTVTVDGGALDGADVADVKHLPPTVSVQYFPMASDSPIQPYVGLGLNYTLFFDEELDSGFESTLGSGGSIKLDDSIGLAFQAGVDYAITDELVLNASLWMVDIDTEADIKMDNGTTLTTDVEIDPLVFMLGVGFRF